LTMWIFYSVSHNLPELYFQTNPSKPIEAFVKLPLPSDQTKLASLITRKEHPVEPKRIVYYLHECKLTEVFDPSLHQVNILI